MKLKLPVKCITPEQEALLDLDLGIETDPNEYIVRDYIFYRIDVITEHYKDRVNETTLYVGENLFIIMLPLKKVEQLIELNK